ncbi:MAG: hypothetical protein Q8P67_27725, partial [archaeon]|nr:hypothetical protein [archaeon]
MILVCLSALLVVWVCGTVEGGTYSVAHRKQGSLVKQRIDPDVQRKKMVANFKLMKEKKLTAYLDDDPFDEKVCSPEDEPVVVPTRVPTEEEIEEMIARRERHMENLWYLGYCGDQQKWRGEWSRRGSFTHAKFRVGRIFDDAVVERPRLQRKWELVQGLGAERAEHKASEDNVIAMTAAQLEMIKWLPCYNGVHIHVSQQRSSKNAMKLRDVVALVAQADYDPASGQGALTQATFKSYPPVSEEDVRTYRPHEDMNRERVWWSLYPPEVDCYVGVSAHLAKTLRLWVGDTIHIKALTMVEDSNHLSATLLPQIPDPLPDHSMLMLVAGLFTSTCERVTPKHPYMIGSRIYQPTVGVASLGKEAQYPTAMTVARIDANSTSIIGMSPAALDLFAVPLKGRMPSFTVEALQRFQKDNYEDNTLLYRLPVVLPPRPRVRGEDPTVVT